MRTTFTIPARRAAAVSTALIAALALGATSMGAAQAAVVPSVTDASVQARSGSELHNNEKLTAGESLVSPNALYRLDVQFDGNMVIYNTRTQRPVWETKTDGKGEIYLHMQADGNLVLYTVEGNTPVWDARTDVTTDDAAKTIVRMADNGSLQVVRNTKVVWNSPAPVSESPELPSPGPTRPTPAPSPSRPTPGPTRPTPGPSRPTPAPSRPVRETTLEQGRAITVGGHMTSENGKYRFGLRNDNTMYVSLVSTGRVLWGLKIRGDAAAQVGVDKDGNLVLLRRDGFILWSTKIEPKSFRARLVMQNDGNAVLYHGDDAVWASNTAQQQ